MYFIACPHCNQTWETSELTEELHCLCGYKGTYQVRHPIYENHWMNDQDYKEIYINGREQRSP